MCGGVPSGSDCLATLKFSMHKHGPSLGRSILGGGRRAKADKQETALFIHLRDIEQFKGAENTRKEAEEGGSSQIMEETGSHVFGPKDGF